MRAYIYGCIPHDLCIFAGLKLAYYYVIIRYACFIADVKFLTTFFDTGNVNYNSVPKFFKNLFDQARAQSHDHQHEFQILNQLWWGVNFSLGGIQTAVSYVLGLHQVLFTVGADDARRRTRCEAIREFALFIFAPWLFRKGVMPLLFYLHNKHCRVDFRYSM